MPLLCNLQYLVFEYVERNLLEVLEEHPGGLDPEQVRLRASQYRRCKAQEVACMQARPGCVEYFVKASLRGRSLVYRSAAAVTGVSAY